MIFTSSGEESHKRERFIQIGKHRHRIANDHHELLTELGQDFRYLRMEDLLFLTSLIGASVLRAFNPMALINVRNRAGEKKGA